MLNYRCQTTPYLGPTRMNSSENAQVRELEHEASYLGLPTRCIREIQNHPHRSRNGFHQDYNPVKLVTLQAPEFFPIVSSSFPWPGCQLEEETIGWCVLMDTQDIRAAFLAEWPINPAAPHTHTHTHTHSIGSLTVSL